MPQLYLPNTADTPIFFQSASAIMSSKFLRPFSCIGVIYIVYQLSGFEVVYAYTENFFEESGVQLEPSLAALLAGKLIIWLNVY